ncbi:MAG: type I glyceraldehyde-3-phosphate dehydrogenase [Deltaproteobacteria bacterium]|nr:type I glyceraldehyde-3-phosphate dehydrogenase [Deltaproteobacteria bacterium]
MSIRIGINGFGRIGRCIVRSLLKKKTDIELVAVNELGDLKTNVHLLKYDSIHGRLGVEVQAKEKALSIGGRDVTVTAMKNPAEIPWKNLGVDIVLECTGLFTDREKASLHLQGGAKKVIISAPAKNPDITVCAGINLNAYDPKNHHIVSNASCTTNCLAPVAKVLHENFIIERALMTTIHSYTNDQRILDVAHSDLRRARSAALSQIPTKTGAAKAIDLVLPELKGKFDGMAIRVPTADVSCVDLVCNVKKETDEKEINAAFEKAANGTLKGILGVSQEPLVSADYIGDPRSSIVDALCTRVIDKKLVKVLAWYDNEMGFSNRMVDVVEFIGKKL